MFVPYFLLSSIGLCCPGDGRFLNFFRKTKFYFKKTSCIIKNTTKEKTIYVSFDVLVGNKQKITKQ